MLLCHKDATPWPQAGYSELPGQGWRARAPTVISSNGGQAREQCSLGGEEERARAVDSN